MQEVTQILSNLTPESPTLPELDMAGYRIRDSGWLPGLPGAIRPRPLVQDSCLISSLGGEKR